MLKTIIRYFIEKPRTLFLTDSLGAILTASFLFILPQVFPDFFGLPLAITTCLSLTAVVLATYSIGCFLFLRNNWTTYLQVISVANALYCIFTIGLLLVYASSITVTGLVYFSVEIIIVFSLVYIEFRITRLTLKS